MSAADWTNLLLRVFVDLVAVAAISILAARRRPQRGLFVVFAAFNVGLFAVLTVITQRHVGPAVGFGLFAMLSIVRLRSEPFGNVELGYFFCALVLALANGLHLDDEWLAVAVSASIVIALWLVDHPALYVRTTRQEVTLDGVFTSVDALRAELGRRLGTDVVSLAVLETDFVREITRVAVRVPMSPLDEPVPAGAP